MRGRRGYRTSATISRARWRTALVDRFLPPERHEEVPAPADQIPGLRRGEVEQEEGCELVGRVLLAPEDRDAQQVKQGMSGLVHEDLGDRTADRLRPGDSGRRGLVRREGNDAGDQLVTHREDAALRVVPGVCLPAATFQPDGEAAGEPDEANDLGKPLQDALPPQGPIDLVMSRVARLDVGHDDASAAVHHRPRAVPDHVAIVRGSTLSL